MAYNLLAADVVSVGYETRPITPIQMDGVRLSETKRARKLQAPAIGVTRTASRQVPVGAGSEGSPN